MKVACGQQHALALTKGGHVYSWGLGVFGQVSCIFFEKNSNKLIDISFFKKNLCCSWVMVLYIMKENLVWYFLTTFSKK